MHLNIGSDLHALDKVEPIDRLSFVLQFAFYFPVGFSC